MSFNTHIDRALTHVDAARLWVSSRKGRGLLALGTATALLIVLAWCTGTTNRNQSSANKIAAPRGIPFSQLDDLPAFDSPPATHQASPTQSRALEASQASEASAVGWPDFGSPSSRARELLAQGRFWEIRDRFREPAEDDPELAIIVALAADRLGDEELAKRLLKRAAKTNARARELLQFIK